tara:strand:+ start:6568 stop:6879 length:312 start_codon:yes stop_codon:yes gene_type:complete
MTDDAFRYSSRDWLGKTSAGLILGFALALSLSGLFALLWPGGLMHSSAKTQLNMWLMSPIWVVVLGSCFLFRSGFRAWLWLGGATLVSSTVLLAVKACLEAGS